jgi:hypothetical protein
MSPEIQLYQATEVAENTHFLKGGDDIDEKNPYHHTIHYKYNNFYFSFSVYIIQHIYA